MIVSSGEGSVTRPGVEVRVGVGVDQEPRVGVGTAPPRLPPTAPGYRELVKLGGAQTRGGALAQASLPVSGRPTPSGARGEHTPRTLELVHQIFAAAVRYK